MAHWYQFASIITGKLNGTFPYSLMLLCVVLGIQLGISHMLDQHSAAEVHTQAHVCLCGVLVHVEARHQGLFTLLWK